jgi:hypothetical protein
MGTYLVKGDTPFEQNIYPALMGALTVAGMEIAYSPEDRDLSLPIRLLK